jgi:hypothetical protein
MNLPRITTFLFVCLLCSSLVYSQDKTKKQNEDNQTNPSAVAPATPKSPLAFGLAEDTPVKIKLARTMSSADAKAGEKVDFEVLEDVKIGDVIVIQHGAMAIGTVTEAHPKRRMGRAGKLNINIDYVQLVSGEKAPLRAVKGGSGGNHTGAMTGAMVATGILFFPAAPFFLFMHGKDITIPKGTEVAAYIGGDTPLDPAKFTQQVAINAVVTPPPVSDVSQFSTVSIKSDPAGAEITLDGKFVGTTPSSVQLQAGEHTVVIDKVGFKSWQKAMTVSAGGSVSLDATLDKLP